MAKKLNTYTLIRKEHVGLTNDGRKIVTPALYRTYDLNIFEVLDANRPITKAHILSIVDSIIKNGMLRSLVVARYHYKLYLVDGQHAKAAIQLLNGQNGNIPVDFTIKDVDSEIEMVELMSDLNYAQKRFSLDNSLVAWSNYSNEARQILEFKKTYGLKNRVLAMILCKETARGASALIKKGHLEFIDIDNGLEKIQNIIDFETYTGHRLLSRGVEGYIDFIDKIGVDKFRPIKRDFLEESKKLFTKYQSVKNFGNKEDYNRFFHEVLHNLN